MYLGKYLPRESLYFCVVLFRISENETAFCIFFRMLYFGHWQPFFILAILSLLQEKILIRQKLRIQLQIFTSKRQLTYLCMFFLCFMHHDVFRGNYSSPPSIIVILQNLGFSNCVDQMNWYLICSRRGRAKDDHIHPKNS